MAKKRAPAKRRPRKAKAGTRGLTPAETRLEELSGTAREVAERIASVGGHLLGSYSDPLGKQPVLVAILPIDRVEATPFQRDLSQVHHRKLADVLGRTCMFMDPIIAVTAPEKGFWTRDWVHHRKLADVLDATGFFLDPIISVTAPQKGLWTWNGTARLAAMRRLGARAITALVVPPLAIAWPLLPLNAEKAHNMREQALAVT